MKHPGYELIAPLGCQILAPPRLVTVCEDGTVFLEDESDWLGRWTVLVPSSLRPIVTNNLPLTDTNSRG